MFNPVANRQGDIRQAVMRRAWASYRASREKLEALNAKALAANAENIARIKARCEAGLPLNVQDRYDLDTSQDAFPVPAWVHRTEIKRALKAAWIIERRERQAAARSAAIQASPEALKLQRAFNFYAYSGKAYDKPHADACLARINEIIAAAGIAA